MGSEKEEEQREMVEEEILKQSKRRRDDDLAWYFSSSIVEASRAEVEAQELKVRMEIKEEKKKRRLCDFPNEDILGGRISHKNDEEYEKIEEREKNE